MKHTRKWIGLSAMIGTFILLSTVLASAQRSSGSVGIGAQFGQPTGLTLKVYKPHGLSPDILVAWDLNDFFFINLHGLVERHIGNSQSVHYFIGPGAFIGVRNRSELDDEVSFGLSGTIGLNVIIDRFEIFGQLTPRLQLIHNTEGDIGGGAGFRVYF